MLNKESSESLKHFKIKESEFSLLFSPVSFLFHEVDHLQEKNKTFT